MSSLYDQMGWKKPERPQPTGHVSKSWGSSATDNFKKVSEITSKKKGIARKMMDKYRIHKALKSAAKYRKENE